MIGTQDLVVGLVLVFFLFGAKRLPELAGSLGKSMKEFKKAVEGGPEPADEPTAPTEASQRQLPPDTPSASS